MAALGSTSAGAATARLIYRATITPGTASGYNRTWLYFQDFCENNGWPALPTCDEASACYYAPMRDRGLKASTMRAYLTAMNNVHAAAGFYRPASGPGTCKLRKGWALVAADRTNSLPPTRVALPAPVMYMIVDLAATTTDTAWRHRYTALLLCFLASRRTCEVLEPQRHNISATPDGGIHLEVNHFKGAEGRAAPERLFNAIPPDPLVRDDKPLKLLREFVTKLDAEDAPPSRLILSTTGDSRPPTADDVTRWLLHALDALKLTPPPGVLYASYSCRAGGAAALYLFGLPILAVAAMLGHKANDPRKALAHYVDMLAPSSLESDMLCGRWRQGTGRPPAGGSLPRR